MPEKNAPMLQPKANLAEYPIRKAEIIIIKIDFNEEENTSSNILFFHKPTVIEPIIIPMHVRDVISVRMLSLILKIFISFLKNIELLKSIPELTANLEAHSPNPYTMPSGCPEIIMCEVANVASINEKITYFFENFRCFGEEK